jgi:hypothetical protein
MNAMRWRAVILGGLALVLTAALLLPLTACTRKNMGPAASTSSSRSMY